MNIQILILDNDKAMRQLLALSVRREGCRAHTSANSDQAEAQLRQGGIDFLLLDLNLGGGGSGEKLAERWAQDNLLPPFYVVTGTPDDHRLATLEGLSQFRGVIAKPFPVLELCGKIKAEITAKEEEL